MENRLFGADMNSTGIIHETIAPYTRKQNGMAERKNRALNEMVNFMLSYLGIIHETIAPYTRKQNGMAERKNRALNEMVNSMLSYLDAIFDENHFSSIPRLKDVIPNSIESQRDDHSDDASSEIHEHRKEEDPRTYNEAMQSRNAAFWKEAIDDEIGYIMKNNTWVLSDLPPGCKPLCYKWIFKRKKKVDGTIDKFKARLVIQGFRQKEGIDYFDTYAPVARITTIRLLLALSAIHNLVIHQMDVKTTFLNGDLDKGVYMKQPEGFLMSGNEHKLEYSRAIGYLMYAMTSTRPDIAYVVGRSSRFTSNPSRQQWKAVTRVFKYLRGTKDYGLSYVRYPSVLEAYLDASWINHVEDSSFTSG
nr:zinc finger, CCHC-type [Tanacetum cinerariifolium]